MNTIAVHKIQSINILIALIKRLERKSARPCTKAKKLINITEKHFSQFHFTFHNYGRQNGIEK